MLRGGPFDRQPALLGKNKKNYTVYKNLKEQYAGRLSKVSFFLSFFLSIFYCQMPSNISKQLDANILQSKLQPVFWVKNNRLSRIEEDYIVYEIYFERGHQ